MNKQLINDLLATIEKREKALKQIAEMERGAYFYKDHFEYMKEVARKGLE